MRESGFNHLTTDGKQKPIKAGLHAVGQMFGDEKHKELFSKRKPAEKLQARFGTKLAKEISRYGIRLRTMEGIVMEGILKALSDTDYEGNADPRTKKNIAEDEYPNVIFKEKLPNLYDNIDRIPAIKIGQRQLLELSGIDVSNQGLYKRGLNAIDSLTTTQYCFYYKRSTKNREGRLLKDENGNWKMETVEAIDTLFKIWTIREAETGKFLHYLIAPSAILVDQIENYFLLIPYKWRDEVIKKVGKVRGNTYLFTFIYFLMYQHEKIRRYNNNHKYKKPYSFSMPWDEVAIKIGFPESMWKGHRKRTMTLLDGVCESALSLGYLCSYQRKVQTDTFVLNHEKYLPIKTEKKH